MSEFKSKKILIIGDSATRKSSVINEIINDVKSYILFEDVENIKDLRHIFDKFSYETIIVSTNKINKWCSLDKYDFIIFMRSSNKETIEISKRLGFTIENLENTERRTFQKVVKNG
jgi:hypothetical protein